MAKRILQFIHASEDPKAIMNVNYIPMSTAEGSDQTSSVMLVKIGYDNEGYGQGYQHFNSENMDMIELTNLLATEYNYHYIHCYSYETGESIPICLAVHTSATDEDVTKAVKTICSGTKIFGQVAMIVAGYDEKIDRNVPDPKTRSFRAKMYINQN